MEIHILCSDGSPLGVTLADLWGKGNRGVGIGGSEYALLTMCEQWHNEGHEVILYNNPTSPPELFEQRPVASFEPLDEPDILIVFRSPNDLAKISHAGKRVWWSCDQFTRGSFKEFAPYMQSIVCISEFHQDYFRETYNICNTEMIDLSIRYQDFDAVKDVKKVKNRMIFTSIPDRGLQNLWYMWPRIKRDIPDAELHITSDYRLWGLPDARNTAHKMQWFQKDGVKFLGAVPREKLLVEQAEAEFLLYPSFYDTAELFCISVAEAQAMGVFPITSGWGALETTNMGTVIPGRADNHLFHKNFINVVRALADNPQVLETGIKEIRDKAYQRFYPENVSKIWNEKVFT